MKIKNITVTEFLKGAGSSACADGKDWARENCATLRDIWQKCERGDWMLWVLRKLGRYDASVSRFLVAMLREMPVGKKVLFDLLHDERSRNVVVILENFLNGKATLEELKEAGDAAYSAAYAASDASYAASAASDAAKKWQAEKLREIVVVEWTGKRK